MTLAPPGTFEAARRADVRLRLLPSAPRPLKNRARVHFHSYTMEMVVDVTLLGTKEIAPGGEGLARLKLPESALLLPGDRFIIRQFSPVVTIGGGVVLDAAPIPRMPRPVDFLETLAGADVQAILKARIARRHQEGISMSRLIAETGWTKPVIETQLASAMLSGDVALAGGQFLHLPALEVLKARIVSAALEFHKKNPLVGGISKEELRAQVDVTPEVFEAVAAMLVREKSSK